MKTVASVLSSRIRQARRAMFDENGRRYSQQTLADKLGVHWTTVSSWERGTNEPTTANLVALAALTERPVEFFFRSNGHGASPEGGGDVGPAERRDGGGSRGGDPGAEGGATDVTEAVA